MIRIFPPSSTECATSKTTAFAIPIVAILLRLLLPGPEHSSGTDHQTPEWRFQSLAGFLLVCSIFSPVPGECHIKLLVITNMYIHYIDFSAEMQTKNVPFDPLWGGHSTSKMAEK